jgi:fructosamine-3-kinase
VYRHVLEPMGARVPRYFGVYRDGRTSCLFLEYLQGAKPPTGDGELQKAETWLAHFHQEAKLLASSDEAAFLIRYDRDYYVGWARRAAEFAEPLRERYPWVSGVCSRFAEYGAPALESEPTVIHGEYYYKNLLMHHGFVYAIDWESCAIGAGEIDVAMLVEGWPELLADDLASRYARERWPEGVAEGFNQRLAFAKVYAQLRWLGEQPEKTLTRFDNFDELRVACERAGLLS